MPKKNKKTKKKSAVLLHTEINIVEEGQSSLDVSDVVRQQTQAQAETPVIEIREETSDSSVREGSNLIFFCFTYNGHVHLETNPATLLIMDYKSY